ncbi:MAG: hypothetical protein JW709_07595, partial [Sedimentisphaerales bacterium]|nr:hypothetical protein [Sedimentisphaerales bacterium]
VDNLPDVTTTSGGSSHRFLTFNYEWDKLDARLKVDIRPTIANEQSTEINDEWTLGKALIRIDSNFHYDVTGSENASMGVLQAISNWRNARKYCDRIVEVLKG